MLRSLKRLFGTRPASRRRNQKSLKNVWRLAPTVLQLEDRVVPSNYLVTTTADIYVPPVPASPPTATSLRYALEQVHLDNSGAVMNILLPAGNYNIGLPVSGVTDTLGNKVGGAFVINPPDGVTDVFVYGGYVKGTPGGTGNNALTLDGNAAGTVINAQGFDRVFEIDPETTPSPAPTLNVHFVNMTITGGAANSKAASGGGIYFDDAGSAPNQNSLSLNNVVVTGNLSTASGGGIYTTNASVSLANASLVSNNHAKSEGGGIYTEYGNVSVDASGVNSNTTSDSGGGIYVAGDNAGGSVSITNGSTVDNNSSDGEGGGVYAYGMASFTLSNSQVNHNLAGDSSGGGIYTNAASISLDHAQISFNQAGSSGGGIYIASNTAPAGNMLSAISVDISSNKSGSDGGGIYNDGVTTLTITYSATPNPFTGNVNSTINDNIAADYGGGIYNDTATTFDIYGTTVSGAGPQGAQISRNDAQGDSGGGVYSDVTGSALVFSLVTMDGNDAGDDEGGAGYIGGSSFLLTGSGSTPSVISNNESSYYGGAFVIYTTVATINSTQFLGNSAATGSGGGIYTDATNLNIGGGTLFAGNQAGSSGGGIYQYSGTTVLNNVAFAPTTGFGGNVSGDNGGALYFSGTSLSVASSFLVGNTADESGGGVYASGSTNSLSNTLVANNVSNTGGGGLLISGGAVTNLALTTVAANMTAGAGGGLNTSATNNVITSSDFLSNNAATGGGGIYNTGTNMLLSMSSVIANTAGGQGSGGGVYNSGTVNVLNTTVANNTAGVGGGGLFNSGTASLLYATLAFNQAPTGGGINTTGTTNLGNSIVSQNFNYAYPGVNFVTNAAYPGNQNGNLLPTPPFPTTATTGPDIKGTVGDLTETALVASMGTNLSAAIGALAAAATTIGHNIFGTLDGNNTGALLAVHGDQVGTSSAPILAVLPVAPNGGSTLVGPTLPGNQAQYMAAPQAAPAGTSNPLTTALKNGFADTFVFNVAPGDQRGTPVLNTVSGLSQQYLRPITITFTMPPSNNPTVGAMQVN